MKRIVLSWSGGKDCAQTLEALHADAEFDVVALLCTLTRAYGRISMHGVRESLLDQQARALGVPLRKVWLPARPDNAKYEAAMGRELASIRQDGIDTIAFGDINLADIRAYREKQLQKAGMHARFPLWQQATPELAGRFIERGYRATVTCVDTTQLDPAFAGRAFDQQLLDDLPAACDPCGENGEFHTFVHDGPPFHAPLRVRTGERILRDERFQFCDLIPH